MYSRLKSSRVFNRASAPLRGWGSQTWVHSTVILPQLPLKAHLVLGFLSIIPFAIVDFFLRRHLVSLVMGLDLWGYLREVSCSFCVLLF